MEQRRYISNSFQNMAIFVILPPTRFPLDLSCQWINECYANHRFCIGNSSLDESSLPTRLLDVNCGSSTIRLVESAQLRKNSARSTWATEPISYCALSHCWGGDIQPRLLLSNTDAMKDDILVENLPKSFQDAITIR